MPARNVVPKPVQRPHPPLWVACSNRDTIRLAAKLGIGALTFAFIDPEEARFWVQEYYDTFKAGCEPIGRTVNPNIAMVTGFMCHEDADVASVGDGGRISEKQQIAARHEGRRQALGADADLCRLRERRVGQLTELAHRHRVIVAEPSCPTREEFPQRREYPRSDLQFDRVALAIVESDGLNPRVALQCPGEAGRRVLSA
jgi:alkanesulfonate monooxygenase SsuD/methylene tetrahydromethanopterin reductase-like flavin-dependent oxidoreductase (luciferase family)